MFKGALILAFGAVFGSIAGFIIGGIAGFIGGFIAAANTFDDDAEPTETTATP